jgi:ribosomal protein S18 acetylase RimI-like enzyme
MSIRGVPKSMVSDQVIRQLQTKTDLTDCVQLLRRSFGTVAEEFSLTEATAPTNPAFVTEAKLKEYLDKPVELFGLLKNDLLIGCVAIEKSKHDSSTFYIERLAVAPEARHQGYGDKLLRYALERIREAGGVTASIGLMDNNDRLKGWYQTKGFAQTACKTIEHLPFKVCLMSKKLV